MTGSTAPVPVVLRLLADPVRWRLMQELSRGDRRVRELTDAVGQPQNLVSYHLRQLRTAGLVGARRSSFDGRDTYYRLDLESCAAELSAAVSALHPGLVSRLSAPEGVVMPLSGRWRVLFVCTGNSGRSPMAEALVRHRAGGQIDSVSAGINPKPLHPDAVAVMRDRHGIDISAHRPTRVEAVAGKPFDFVITLCDKAREHCPDFPRRPGLVHWSMADPAAAEGDLAGYTAFVRTAAELDTRIRYFLLVLRQGWQAAS